jgi:hypothetical protein
MMGAKARLFTPIHARSLDELVPADHFYRHVDRVLDLGFVRDLVQDCYAAGMGRPSVDPRVFFKLQLVMLFEGIRSERQLLRLAAQGGREDPRPARVNGEQRGAQKQGFHKSVSPYRCFLPSSAEEKD